MPAKFPEQNKQSPNDKFKCRGCNHFRSEHTMKLEKGGSSACKHGKCRCKTFKQRQKFISGWW